MNESERNRLVSNMTENLPVLRKKLNISQQALADMIGVSRSTVTNIESGKRAMTWNTFLSLVLIFMNNSETDRLLGVLEIYTDGLNDFIRQKKV